MKPVLINLETDKLLCPLLTKTNKYLLALSANNNRDWFHANKPSFQEAKDEFMNFLDQLIQKMHDFEDLGDIRPKDCMYRIQRDVRFSPNKTPYNTHFSAMISSEGRRSKKGPYYLRIKPDGVSVVAGGIWEGKAAMFQAIRQEIDYNIADFKAILTAPKFKDYFGEVWGESLKRPPKGFDPNHPEIELLKKKQFLFYRELDKSTYRSEGFLEKVIDMFKAAKPFLDFVNVPVTEYYENQERH